MRRRITRLCPLPLVLLAACSGQSADAADKAPAADATTAVVAAPPARALLPVPGPTAPPIAVRPPQSLIDITLRSTPPGAAVTVNGVDLGVTPTLWQTSKTATAHTFSFSLKGYEKAEYRFVPIRSGIVHPSLKKRAAASADAGRER